MYAMPILTVRISDEEKEILAQRAEKAGVKAGTLVRQMIRETPLETADDLLQVMEKRLGDARLRIRPRA